MASSIPQRVVGSGKDSGTGQNADRVLVELRDDMDR